MEIKDNFLDKDALQVIINKKIESLKIANKQNEKLESFICKLNKKVEKDYIQTEKVRKYVYEYLKIIESDVNEYLQGLKYTLSANINYNVDEEEEFLLTIIAESNKTNLSKIKQKFISWIKIKTYPFEFPKKPNKKEIINYNDDYSCYDTIGATYLQITSDEQDPKKHYTKLTFTFHASLSEW